MATQTGNAQIGNSRESTTGRLVLPISSALAAVPYAAIALLYLFAWDTSRRFGAWPTPSTPDPKDASEALYTLTFFGFLATLPAMFALVVGLPLVRRFQLRTVDKGIMLFAVVGCTALAYVFAGDLGVWFAD